MTKKLPFSIEQRFWLKVVKTETCWIWKGPFIKRGKKSNGGYGRFCITASRQFLAHRYSWQLHNGNIPDNLFVLHKCDNKACVNPKHLFLGTHQDNMNDAYNKNLFITREKRLEKNGAI